MDELNPWRPAWRCRAPATAVLGLLLAVSQAGAADLTAAGNWQQIDDDTGKVGAIVAISEVNGLYQGALARIFVGPGEDPNPKCEKCSGARHNKPLAGLVFIEGMKRAGFDYTGGQILDPDSGQIYNATMKLSSDGEKLVVTGYALLPIFSGSQTWLRDHSASPPPQAPPQGAAKPPAKPSPAPPKAAPSSAAPAKK